MVVSDALKGVVWSVLESLSTDPYSGLYSSLLGGEGPSFVRAEGYLSLVHQVDLYTEYLVREPVRLLVADEIGLGKTVEALHLVKLVLRRLGGERALVVVPASLLVQWREEDARALGVPMTVIDSETIGRLWEELRITGSIAPGVYIGSMDTLKLDRRRAGSPYWELVSSVSWDLVVVDEAHKLGILSGRPSMRYKRIGGLCREARHCLLLTATPTRGDTRDLLERLRLLEPGLNVSVVARAVKRGDRRGLEALQDLRRLFIVRRSKEVLRYAEKSFRVPDAVFLLGLVQLPRDEEEFYDSVYSLAGRLLEALGHGKELGLLRALLVKRALSSPLGFARTLARIVSGRRRDTGAQPAGDTLLSILYEDAYEPSTDSVAEPDSLEESLLEALPVRGRLLEEARVLAGKAEAIARQGDAAVRALAGMLSLAPSGKPLLGDDEDTIYPNILVFTEYLDTLEYIRSMLARLLPENGLAPVPESAALSLASQLSPDASRERLRGWVEAYQSRNGVLIIYYVSSRNRWIIPWIVEAVRRSQGKPGMSVAVVSTDIAGEGLNLQGANILVNYEVTWSMVKREQRIGRVWRIGQRRRVYIIDLIRATPLDRIIYERLLTKIYMLSLATGSPMKTGPSGIALVRAEQDRSARILSVVSPSETSAGRVLEGVARALEKLPGGDRAFETEIDSMAREIMARLEAYKAMASLLQGEKAEDQASQARRTSRILYGAESHEDAHNAVKSLAEACGLPSGGELGELLVSLENACRPGEPPGRPVVLISGAGGDWETALIGVTGISRGGRPVLRIPLLVLARRGGYTAYHGYEAVRKLGSILGSARPLESGAMSVLPGEEDLRRSGVLAPLAEASRSVAGRILSALASRARKSLIEPADRLGRMGALASSPKPAVLEPVEVEPISIILKASPEGKNGGTLEERLEVERAGIRVVRRLLESRGYLVEDVHDRGLPYDLVARPRDRLFGDELLVEVKAHSGGRLSGALTMREAMKAEEDPDRYIVCLVAFATTSSPLAVCKPYREWRRAPWERARVESGVIVYP